MVAIYILILCLSTGFAAWAACRLWQRLAPMAGGDATLVGACAMAPVLAFLIVVGAPASMLFFASATLALPLLAPRLLSQPIPKNCWIALCVAVPLIFLHAPDVAAWARLLPITGMISFSLYAVAFVWWGGVVALAPRLAPTLPEFSITVIAACLPLAAAPLLVPQSSSVAVDAALLSAGWLGAMLCARMYHQVGVAAQIAAALILGYLQIIALWHGAWPMALLSLLVWVLGTAYVVVRRHAAERVRLAEILPYA